MSYHFLYGIFHFNLWCSLLWFWVLSAVSLQNLTLNFNCFHIFEMWMKIFPLAGWWIHLIVCWLSSFFLSASLAEVLYIKRENGVIHLGILCLQSSSPAFKIFFFFFLIYVLWDLFPDKIFCCLFLFCSTISLIFGFWHQTLHWRSHRSVCFQLVALHRNILAMTYAFMLSHSFPATKIF